jgi:N-acylglucosamine-6-phosphate 2-epimerase
MSAVLDLLRGGLIVSVQAPAESPLAGPPVMAAIARAAVAGGAIGIRAEGVKDVAAIRAAVDVPIVGLRKRDLSGSAVRITPTLDDALAIAAAGADVVAVDATLRPRPDGTPTADFLAVLTRELDVPVLADVDTLEAGVAAALGGVAAVATTLSGYTDAPAPTTDGPDLPLLRALAERLERPLLAEGRYGSPADVRAAFDAGAQAVVVGTAITDPFTLTRRFAAAARPQEAHVRDR